VALGNVLRGFPLEPDGTFELDLFSVGSPRAPRGMIDGYTLATGVFGLAVLVVHGARFVAMRTDGPVRARCAALGNRAMVPVAILWAAVTALSFRYAPGAVTMRPLVAALIATALASFGLSWQRARSGDVRTAFLASAGQIFALVGAAAASAYPVLLRSTRAGVPSLTVANAASPDEALQAGLSWWFVAAALVVLYFGNLFRVHRGRAATYGEGAEP
jgi:cytochrome d ubiquinol oxidase subunit II